MVQSLDYWVRKLVIRRRRLATLEEMEAPAFLIEREKEMIEDAVNHLVEVYPDTEEPSG